MERNDKTRPIQLVGLALAAGAFIGGIVSIVTRDGALAALFGGGAFIVTILVLAMIVLTTSPELPTQSRSNPHE